MGDVNALAAGHRSCNGTPPACFENCFACFRMPSHTLGTQPEDVPFARTVVGKTRVSLILKSSADDLPNSTEGFGLAYSKIE